MTVWVYRNGKLVEKPVAQMVAYFENRERRSDLPSPLVSCFDSYHSPVDDSTVSSWRQRDADMKKVDAVDPRDLDRKPFEERKARNARLRETPAEWS